MTDGELIDGFASSTLLPEAFHHREHVRLTWLYLERHGRIETERRLIAGLRALAGRAGKPDKFDEALTLAWVAAIDSARDRRPGTATFDAFACRHPQLLDRRFRPPRAVRTVHPSVT